MRSAPHRQIQALSGLSGLRNGGLNSTQSGSPHPQTYSPLADIAGMKQAKKTDDLDVALRPM